MVKDFDIKQFYTDDYSLTAEEKDDKEWQHKIEEAAASFDRWLNSLNKAELEKHLNVWNTPSLWAETYLSHPDDPSKPLQLKDFQKTVIDDWHPNVAVRIGRQRGKCQAGNALVHLADGTLERVEALFNKHEQFDIIGMDARFNQVIRKAIVHDNGTKPCVKVKLRGGLHTEVTTNHRFLTISKTTGRPTPIYAEDIQPGDYIAVPDEQLSITTEKVFTDDEIKLIGYYTAEGSLTHGHLGFTNFDQEIVSDFFSACAAYGPFHDNISKSSGVHEITYPTLKGNPVRDLMRRAGLANKHSRDKQCLPEIMRSPLEQKALYLSCLIDCDGWIDTKNQVGIGITLVSERLIYDIRTLFLQLGIHGNISYQKKKCHNTGNSSDTWTYYIGEKAEILKAAAVLKLKAKTDKLAIALEKLDDIVTNNNQNVLPPQLKEYTKKYKYSQPKGKQLSDLPFRLFKNNYAPQKYKVEALGNIYDDQYLKDIASAPIRWKTVESIEFIGEQQTYAIEILDDITDDLRYLVVDGIWQHNSVVLCARAVWFCMRYAHRTFLIATPTRAQVWRLFEVLSNTAGNLIDQNQIHITRGNPMIVRFANGSKLVGFSCIAGTKITTKDGLKNVEDLKVGDVVLALDTDSGATVWLPITEVFLPNHKDVYQVTLANGYEVTVSDAHPFWTPYGWKQLKDLAVGDKVATVSDYKLGMPTGIDKLGLLLGMILGDGSITTTAMADGGPRFTSKNPSVQKLLEDTASELNIAWRSQIHAITGSKEYTLRKRLKQLFGRPQDKPLTPLSELLYDYALVGMTSKDKFIPDALFNRSPEFRAGLLQGLMITDGFLCARGRAGFCSISNKLAYNVRDLLSSFGIKSRVRCKLQAGHRAPIDTAQREIVSQFDLYEVLVASKYHVNKLLNLVDLSAKKTYAACKAAVQGTKEIASAKTTDFSTITRITEQGKQTTYDIAVGDGTNNFVANGIVLHNTVGTKSGRKAFGVRGQTADVLAMDECVDQDTTLQTVDGLIRAKDITRNTAVLSFDEKAEYESVLAAKNTGVKQTIRLICETGNSLTCTENHPVLTRTGWSSAKTATELGVPTVLPYKSDRALATARLCGLILGDGWIYDKSAVVGFSGSVSGLMFAAKDVQLLFPQYKCTIQSRTTNSPNYGIAGTTNSFSIAAEGYQYFKKLGLPSGNKTTQCFGVPEIIRSGSAQEKAEFLAALFGAEGSRPAFRTNGITPRTITLRMHKVPKLRDSMCAFFSQLVDLLAELGIAASYRWFDRPQQTSYCVLSIAANEDNYMQFLSSVGYRYAPEKERLATIHLHYLQYKRQLRDHLDAAASAAKDAIAGGMSISMAARKYSIPQLDKWLRRGSRICTPNSVQPFDIWVADKIHGDVLYLTIQNKSDAGLRPVYNFTIDNKHTYIANGFITHNCDHMSEGDIATLLGIKSGRGEGLHVWMSSTPTGERKQFYTVCTKPGELDFHAYHFLPQQMLDYDPKTDNYLRTLMTAEEYDHEVAANFGAIASGVFRPELIDAALSDDEPPYIDGTTTTQLTAIYPDYNPQNVYVIGVDWNTMTVGQCITVVEWDPKKRKSRIWLQEETPNREFSHSEAVVRISELARRLHPTAICVDYGYGDADIELLRLIDKENPGYNLAEKLIILNFGVDIEVEDPITGQKIKKDAKPFVINTLVKMLEDKMIVLPKYWDRQNRLVEDMRNFMVVRRTEGGAMVYTRANDHRIISYCLATFGVALKGNLLFNGASGALHKIVLRDNDIWQVAINQHPASQRSVERTSYFKSIKHSSVMNKHFSEEKYDENSLAKLRQANKAPANNIRGYRTRRLPTRAATTGNTRRRFK